MTRPNVDANRSSSDDSAGCVPDWLENRVRPNVAAMAPYVPGEQPQGGKFIKLNTNENPGSPSPKVWSAIQSAWRAGIQRYPDPDATAFRLAAADLLKVPPDWILCGNGSDDILNIAVRALVEPRQTIRSPTPTYVLYRTLAQAHGAALDEVPFDRNWQLGAEMFQPRAQLRLIFLANPNSPSGTAIAPDQVLRLARQTDAMVLVDEAYADFANTNCLSLVAQEPRIMVSRSLSKSYALAGLRFGFVVAQPPVIEQLYKVKDSYNCDALSIAGATAAIGDRQWLEESVAGIRRGREQLTRGLQRLGFDVTPSQANFVWCRHPACDAQQLYRRLKQQGILVRYMDYGIDCGAADAGGGHRGGGHRGGDGLRISVGTEAQIDSCLHVLHSLLTA